ncbi:hypothetical protein BGX38DRAFT_1256454, partial [Terfezia claveryi]
MSALSIKLSRQLRNFTNGNKIITNDKDKEYTWHFGSLKYNLSQGVENRVVNAIVTKWEQEGIEDIGNFQSRLGMRHEAVVTMVQGLGPVRILKSQIRWRLLSRDRFLQIRDTYRNRHAARTKGPMKKEDVNTRGHSEEINSRPQGRRRATSKAK